MPVVPEPTQTSAMTVPTATSERRNSFATLSTVTEEPETTDDKSDTTSEAPASLFSHTEPVSIVLPEAPTEVPAMLIPAKNPKLYQLVQMSGEGSFWWDSTDSTESGGLGQTFTPPQQDPCFPVEYGKSRLVCLLSFFDQIKVRILPL